MIGSLLAECRAREQKFSAALNPTFVNSRFKLCSTVGYESASRFSPSQRATRSKVWVALEFLDDKFVVFRFAARQPTTWMSGPL